MSLCPTGAQTCVLLLLLLLLCDRDIDPLTLKHEGHLDILNMYPHTENEAAS